MSWRDVILVKCIVCKKLMSYHKPAENETCVECEIAFKEKSDARKSSSTLK